MVKALVDTLAKTLSDVKDKTPFHTLNNMKAEVLIERLATH